MITQILDDFNLEKTAESGQCFRWEKADTAKDGAHSLAGSAEPAPAERKTGMTAPKLT